ncbi:hypothetical protein PUN28_002015 [Cardiocondyla obscurior]|uniref:Ribosomal protein L2 n=1 Tax=Cardiocondyla obscurior TaxID=286306 RepID=A0AAW2GSD9_9HYME
MRSRRAEGYTNIFILMFARCALRSSLRVYTITTRSGDSRGCGVLLPQYGRGVGSAARGLPRIFYGTSGRISHVP